MEWMKLWLTVNGDWLLPLSAVIAIVVFVFSILTATGRHAWGIISCWALKRATRVIPPPAATQLPRQFCEVGSILKLVFARSASIFSWLWYRVAYLTPGLNYRIPERPKPIDALEFARMENSSVWFSNRFADAFPGIRDPTEYESARDIAHRLGLLLRDPLAAADGNGSWRSPTWWTRGGSDMGVSHWYRLKPRRFLMDIYELNISRIVAIPGQVYWQNCVYIECRAERPVSAEKLTPQQIEASRARRGFADQEYGLYRFRSYTRQEYDDGGATRRGRVKHFKNGADLRVRYLTKYNFLLVPTVSPVHTQATERGLRTLLNNCLTGTATPWDLSEWVLSQPRSQRYH